MVRRNTLILATVAALIALASPPMVSPAAQAPQSRLFELEEATIADLQHRMETGQNTSRSLVEQYLTRTGMVDLDAPQLRSILELNPDALAIADERDAERRGGHVRGPLHGIPILLKDNIATGDRMMTTAGSRALAGPPVPADAFIVERLRAAGAVILGKTNLS